jgi:hypothetical protein
MLLMDRLTPCVRWGKNAFGDFLAGLTDACGRAAHRIEIEATARRMQARV